MKGWDRVNVYNLRILKDLTSFANSADDFKHIRRAVAQLTDPSFATGASEEAASVRSSTRGRLADGKANTGVPFLGVSSPLPRFVIFLRERVLIEFGCVGCRNLPRTVTTSVPSPGPDRSHGACRVGQHRPRIGQLFGASARRGV